MADKTEAPTPRRREEARRRGQVAKSVEVNTAVVLLLGFYVFNADGSRFATSLSTLMQRSFGSLAAADFTLDTVRSGGLTVIALALQAIAPLVVGVMVAGVIANVAQVGFMFSEEALKPNLTRINPMTGLQRIFSMRGLVELGKSLLKLAAVSFMVYVGIRDNYAAIAAAGQMPLAASVALVAQVAASIGTRTALVILVVAAADYMFQRRQHENGLRMTRQELIEEMKRYENTQMKNRIRARQRQLAMRRMMSAVPKADVVITNPVHLAVALQYEQGKMRAPRVVAKGQRLVAERIKDVARQHEVPLVENRPLAQALFHSAEVGHEIPADLYGAVAEVLAFVYRLRSGRSRPAAVPAQLQPSLI
jgi:flagellar biosynthetic protein FlhB